MKTVVIPTDFSACANNALNYATGFAARFESKMIIHNSIHVMAPAREIPLEGVAEEEIYREANSKVSYYRELPAFKDNKLNVDFDVRFGFAVENIDTLARNVNADIIIMGTKGASGIDEVILGSNTAKVIENASCPVLVIPANAIYREIKQIVYATNFRDNDTESLMYLAEIAKAYNAKIKIIHVSEVPQNDNAERMLFREFESNIKALNIYNDISFELLLGWNIPELIQEAITESKADLLAVSTRKRGFFAKLISPGITKKIIYQIQLPTLVFHS